MEAVGVLGGGGPSGSASSSHLSSTERACRSTGYSSSYVPCNRRSPRAAHLAALYSPSRLFSYSPSLLYDAKSRKAPKTHIFLPHLVASTEQVEETYIMVKPDGVQHGLVGEIISRFEKKGFKLTGLKLFQCPKELAEEHYKDLKGRPFFPKLINYIASGPVVCMAWEGVGVVASARKLIGSTDPLQAEPGTIRGDLAVQTGRNVVHGSDSPENGKREIALWFKEDEVCQWTPVLAPSEHSIIEACSFEEFSAKHLHFSLIHHLISQFRIILYQRMMKYSIFNLYEVPLRKFETCFSF